MDNYKIKVKDEAESKEAQELFVQLGYELFKSKRIGIVATEDNGTVYPDVIGNWDAYEGKELTLPQLRDLVVLKRGDVKDATHQDKYDASLKYVYLNGEWYEWINGWMAGCINPAKLTPITQTQDPALISGAEALRALADGKEVEFQQNENWYSIIYSNVHVKCVLNDSYKLRLKPQTIKVELELPKPFEPQMGDRYWIIHPAFKSGYTEAMFGEAADKHQSFQQFGAYRTEEDVKKAVEQLRKIRGTNS
ncbi:hypothetical protein [Acinetobacter baumannii]|uniref:hypothetical protein n=1 Tax=Acinetobacter baumannii TaxID=470 RepID=UPI001EFA74A3|nr:hypothetical protein [Acinetobacter baumannii]